VSIQRELAVSFVERAKYLGLKGKARDNAVLDFFCGAACALEKVGKHEEAQQVGMTAAMILSTRGYLGLIEFVTPRENVGVQ
jgi:hypothetical protein